MAATNDDGSDAGPLDVARVEELALADYRSMVGKVVLLSRVTCSDRRDDSNPVDLVPPAVGRVVAHRSEAEMAENILRWMEEDCIDPVYRVEILEPHAGFADVRPYFAYGSTRSTNPKYVDPSPDFRLADDGLQERYKDAPALDDANLGGCAPGGRTREVALATLAVAAAEAADASEPTGAGEDVAEYVAFARRNALRIRIDAVTVSADGEAATVSICKTGEPFLSLPVEVAGDLRAEGGLGRALRYVQGLAIQADAGELDADMREPGERLGRVLRLVMSEAAMEEFMTDLGDARDLRASPSP